ncbi:MAG: alpha amylase C-terminal domain-containing protein [Dermatophilaceae bacterium]
MALPQDHIVENTPVGATLVEGGAVFRAWAPRARAVHVCYDGHWQPSEDNLLVRGPAGHWTGFVAGLGDDAAYKFWVRGEGSAGFKRDPRARELSPLGPPHCVVRNPAGFPWHDGWYRPPAFNDLVLYQLHVGSFFVSPGTDIGTFLDVLSRIDHLKSIGINALQLLPIAEFPTSSSLGYNGTDLFSPEQRYVEQDAATVEHLRDVVNGYLARAGQPGLTTQQLQGAPNQLKALVDVCHLNGLAVLLDLVLNHAGAGFDDESLYFFDRAPAGDNNNSLYFTDQGWAGGLLFAFWSADVRQFLIDIAGFYLAEYHVDGFRYDALNLPVQQSPNGWMFCQHLTGTARARKPEAIQIAEYWPMDPWVVKSRDEGGAGLDAMWGDGLREALRGAVAQASWGRDAGVDLDRVAAGLYRPWDVSAAWKTVQYVESHDEVRFDRGLRVPRLADGNDARSWYARSRSRVATGLLLTAPGVPMLFMGQEMLEERAWTDDVAGLGNILGWEALESGDKVRGDFLRFVSELLRVRSDQPALRGEAIHVHHVHNRNRVLAFHRWIEGVGRDVVVVVSLNDSTQAGYRIGMPRPGRWGEALNSDVYDNWVNPWMAGNGGQVWADGPPMHDMPSSASITIPANSILVLA